MGSFTEGRLTFDFREDVPTFVLAAFAAHFVPGRWDDTAPPLPAPHVADPDEEGEAMWELDDDEPWLHDWASWIGSSMSVHTDGYAALSWTSRRWRLDCRFSWKTDLATCAEALDWLAPFVTGPTDRVEPVLLGTLRYENDGPTTLWASEGHVVLEDPNTRESKQPWPGAATLVLVAGLPGAGRTSYLEALRHDGSTSLLVDDFHAQSFDNDPGPKAARSYGTVVQALLDGRDVVLSDLRFSTASHRGRVARELVRGAPFAKVRTICFADDPGACETRLRERAASDPSVDLAQQLIRLANWAPLYEADGEVLPIGTLP